MQNLERSEFDEQWKEAFAEAEATPGASVWANVDKGLALADSEKEKRRVIFYQRLAAAFALFAVTAGAFGIYHWRQSEIQIAKLIQTETTDVHPKSTLTPTQKIDAQRNQSTDAAPPDDKKIKTLRSTRTAKVTRPNDGIIGDENENRTIEATQPSAEKRTKEFNSGKSTEVATPLLAQISEDDGSSQNKMASTVTPFSKEKNTAARSTIKSDEIDSKKSSGDKEKLSESRIATVAQSSPVETYPTVAESKGKRSVQKTSGDITGNLLRSTAQSHSAGSNLPMAKGEDTMNDIGLAANVNLPRLELLPTLQIDGDPKLTEIYRRLPYIPASFMKESDAQKFEHEKLWASVTAAEGSYAESTGTSYNTPAAMQLYAQGLLQTSPQSANNQGNGTTGPVPTVGKSYSYGVIGGVRLTQRWVLQTGLQYMTQMLGSATSQYANYGSGGLISTNEFVSVPVQAGYLLINRKIAWQLNPGVSTDFFLRNTLSNQQTSVSQGAGDSSPYRSVNFAGLMSSEFSYKLGRNYRISLVPGMRYSLNPALKSTANGSAIAWDLGFRFRYIFK